MSPPRYSRFVFLTGVLALSACNGGLDSPAIEDPPDARDRDPSVSDAVPEDVSHESTWRAGDGVLPTQACAPWTLVDQANPEPALLNGDGLTLATNTNADNIWFTQAADALDPGPVWTLTADVRIDRAASTRVNRTGAAIEVGLGATNSMIYLFIDVDAVFLGGAGGEGGPRGRTVAATTTDRLHEYRLVIDRAAATVDVYRDGVLILSDEGVVTATPVLRHSLRWGDLSSYANGISQWGSFSHDGHAAVACP